MNKHAALDRLTALETEAAELRKIINEPEKPVIRHGDYGYHQNNNCCPRIFHEAEARLNGNKKIHAAGNKHGWSDDPQSIANEYTILGNIFDDLKLYGEDCEDKFVIHNGSFLTDLRVEGCGQNTIIQYSCDCVAIANEKLESFAKKLLQRHYTLQRKASK